MRDQGRRAPVGRRKARTAVQIGGSQGAGFQITSGAGVPATAVVGGGGAPAGAGSALDSMRIATTTIGGGSGAAPAASGGSSTPTNAAIPTLVPFAAPQLQPVANAGAASGADAQQRVQALLAGNIQPTPQERPYVDAIRAQQAAPAATAAAASPVIGGGREQNEFEQRVFELVNQERARYGIAPVRYQAILDTAATSHNAQQAATQTMAHEGIGDGTPGDRARAAGWNGSWGENVAVGQTSPEQVVAEWMASPGHRRNILDPGYSQMGVSYTTDAAGRPYWAQSFGS